MYHPAPSLLVYRLHDLFHHLLHLRLLPMAVHSIFVVFPVDDLSEVPSCPYISIISLYLFDLLYHPNSNFLMVFGPNFGFPYSSCWFTFFSFVVDMATILVVFLLYIQLFSYVYVAYSIYLVIASILLRCLIISVA